MTRQEMVRELGQINGRLKAPIDIVTFTGFMDTDEVAMHLQRYREVAKNPEMAHQS